jgi:DNA polymerase I
MNDLTNPHLDSAGFLAGDDPTPRILSVEPAGSPRLAVFRRDENGIVTRDDAEFRPWLVAARFEPWVALRPEPDIEELNGNQPLRHLVTFSTWSAFQDAVRAGKESKETFFHVNSASDQYLITSGRTLFKQMVFEDLRRLQLDIETTGLDPTVPEGRIVIAALRSPEGEEIAITARSEEALLTDLTAAIRRIDPDVIEGHNIFNFDIPFIVERAARWSVDLCWGRDGSPVRMGQRRQRFKVGPLSLAFQPAYIYGRHIVDTYQQIQRYDVGGRLTSYGLKPAVEALGLTRPGRELVSGEQIRDVWHSDPERVVRYAIDDVRDVDLLSRLALPTEFYQTQLLPRPFQQVATTGPGTKINDLMLRAYLSRRESLPLPSASQDYPGGHAELLKTGVFSPIVKCDVESLYPSLMLSQQITSSRDSLGVYLPMLRELTRRRLHAKRQSRIATGQQQAVWEGLQSSFKVLINSFYGYLGFGGALFNDYNAATEVTLAGQRAIKSVVGALEASGAIPIEVDTDGVYFVPPPDIASESEERAFIEQIESAALSPGIRLVHDGRYRAMLSLHLKNYALLSDDGRITLKGSSLRSRRLEPFIRDFLLRATRAFMIGDRDAAREDYFSLAEQIRARTLGIHQISQWAMIHDDTITSQPRLKRLLDRLPQTIAGGERVQIYEREDGELAIIEEYARDENVAYLLRRLSDSAGRFEPLFNIPQDLAAFFPPITARTDLDAAKAQEASTQLSLF